MAFTASLGSPAAPGAVPLNPAAQYAHFGPLSTHPLLQSLGPHSRLTGHPPRTSVSGYGSGAGSAPQTAPAGVRSNPRPRFRSRSVDGDPRRGRPGHSHWAPTDRPSRSTPAGPVESNDWLDALNDARNQIDTLRNQQLNQAAGMAAGACDAAMEYC